MPDLVASVQGLFDEDAGRHDPSMDLSRPEREGAEYYSGLVNDPTRLLKRVAVSQRPVSLRQLRTNDMTLEHRLDRNPQRAKDTGPRDPSFLHPHVLRRRRVPERRPAAFTAEAAALHQPPDSDHGRGDRPE